MAVVTGASSGIGRAVAGRLAADGATVLALGRDQARLDSLAKETAAAGPASPVGGALVPVQLDLTDSVAVERFAADTVDRYGRVHLLVHSAGGYLSSRIEDASVDDFDAQYAANVRGPFALTRSLLPALRAAADSGESGPGGAGAGPPHGADVVIMNSSQGVRAGAGTSQFAATQHAMRAVADSLRQEVNADGIRVVTIHLGRTATPRQETIFEREGRPYRPELLIQAEDVADLVTYLALLPRTAEVTELHLRPAQKSY
ncbi:short-chain dehydrogenase [Parafrankia colletiae]|uniref:Short-chain dehydrogenase n=1 Tax=Parafrankia colletiae TaxID=573497 RepID=A0A1S1Q737_9ACTN|nr:SDR family NAD(P)-dependent oxidoreductase [Parafrankia colletiae]MCK9900327.1 SDR family NAD(P)-dependent oxidoreductase [Frankia sp. Cpl3]OHV30698.1 short-chain dehydrogenase [Parafrankia colletiae]